MTPTTETWRPVPGWEGFYEVSDHGSVRSVDRTFVDAMGRTRNLRGRQLKAPVSASNGRRMVNLTAPDRPRRVTTVYTLVMEAFVGPRPEGLECCHNDGDQLNDRLENLRWDTPSANSYDTVRHGRNTWANRTHCSAGHELVALNLVPSMLPSRHCRACWRAKNNERYARTRGWDVPDVTRLADWHYERILRGA